LQAGKKVRTDTTLNEGAVSISYAAVELARRASQPYLHPFTGRSRTNKRIDLAAPHEKDCKLLTIVNRTYENACELALKYNCEAQEFDKLEQLLLVNDIVITSTPQKKPSSLGISSEMRWRRGTTGNCFS